MPTLPSVKIHSLKNVRLGSLVTLKDSSSTTPSIGFRAAVPGEKGDDPEPAFVELKLGSSGGIEAKLIRTWSNEGGTTVNGSTRVVNHGEAWKIHVSATDWDAEPTHRNFAFTDAGLLLIAEDSQPALAVSAFSGCRYLNLVTWLAEEPKPAKYVAARVWNLYLPGPGTDLQSPLS